MHATGLRVALRPQDRRRGIQGDRRLSPVPTMINFSCFKISIKVAKGMVGYFRFPEQRAEWGGPFNGQEFRMRIFRELHRTYGFNTVIETGAYRGVTTAFLADETGGKVRTVEAEPWSYGYCRCRFLLHRRISAEFGDSRKFLEHVGASSSEPSFFYLDAHWGDDLPLRDELEQILTRWDTPVIMIDDFKVPDDAHYGFDDYGKDRTLALDYIEPAIEKFRPSVFFPAARGAEETGARRGCVVLIGRKVMLPKQSFATLREYRSRTCG